MCYQPRKVIKVPRWRSLFVRQSRKKCVQNFVSLYCYWRWSDRYNLDYLLSLVKHCCGLKKNRSNVYFYLCHILLKASTTLQESGVVQEQVDKRKLSTQHQPSGFFVFGREQHKFRVELLPTFDDIGFLISLFFSSSCLSSRLRSKQPDGAPEHKSWPGGFGLWSDIRPAVSSICQQFQRWSIAMADQQHRMSTHRNV